MSSFQSHNTPRISWIIVYQRLCVTTSETGFWPTNTCSSHSSRQSVDQNNRPNLALHSRATTSIQHGATNRPGHPPSDVTSHAEDSPKLSGKVDAESRAEGNPPGTTREEPHVPLPTTWNLPATTQRISPKRNLTSGRTRAFNRQATSENAATSCY